MNIDTLLPFLLKGNNAEMLKIFSALKSDDKSKALEALLPKDSKNEQLLNVIKMTNKKPPAAAGLGAIEDLASNEILGILVKYYSC